MRPTLLPDYAGGSIVNLMQSIGTACGSPRRLYPELPALPADRLAQARTIILIVVDGLGLRTLRRNSRAPHLQRHLLTSITSVFPSTTASAITTFLTGLAPAQHGLTGWHMYLEEVDQVLSILPLTPRVAPAKVPPGELPAQLFAHQPFCQLLARDCWFVSPRSIAASPFNLWHARAAEIVSYGSLPELFAALRDLATDGSRQRYIYAYFPDLDSLSHQYGTDSREARRTLAGFDALFGEFIQQIRGSQTFLLVTADHGFIDAPIRHLVQVEDHPHFSALLHQPLCGERRVAYCYVKAEQSSAFETYVRQRLARSAHVYRSDQLVAAGWFGPPPCHPRLFSRIGDYTLVMKGNCTIKDWLPGEKRYTMNGVHGGISAQEMRVPLIALLV